MFWAGLSWSNLHFTILLVFIRGVTIQKKRIAIFFHCIAIYWDTLFSLYFHRNAINFSIFAIIFNLTYENQNYTHAHMSVWRPLIRVWMLQAWFFWTYYCDKIRDEWKRNSSNRKEKSRDILRYIFRIAIWYKCLVYCDISIYCDTPSVHGLVWYFCLKKSVSIVKGFKLLWTSHMHRSVTIKICDKYMYLYLGQVNSKQYLEVRIKPWVTLHKNI